MFKDSTIRKAVMEVIDTHIENQQNFYDEECSRIDEEAEAKKSEVVGIIVKKIASTLTN